MKERYVRGIEKQAEAGERQARSHAIRVLPAIGRAFLFLGILLNPWTPSERASVSASSTPDRSSASSCTRSAEVRSITGADFGFSRLLRLGPELQSERGPLLLESKIFDATREFSLETFQDKPYHLRMSLRLSHGRSSRLLRTST